MFNRIICSYQKHLNTCYDTDENMYNSFDFIAKTIFEENRDNLFRLSEYIQLNNLNSGIKLKNYIQIIFYC